MAKNAIFHQDVEIKQATAQLETIGFKVERQGLRTKVYKQGIPASKWLEVRQLLGMARYYARKASPMELAMLKAGLARSK